MTFYERRARRILPALFVVLAATLPFSWAWMEPQDFQDYLNSLAAAALFFSNAYFWESTDYFATAAELRPLLHTWSLAVEEQYYLVFPLIVMALGTFTRGKYLIFVTALACASLALSEWGWRNYYTENFFFTLSRVWELFIGSICAIIAFRKPVATNQTLPIVGLDLILVSIFAFDKSTPSPSAYILFPTIGTALILLFAHTGTWVAWILSRRLPVTLGLISYSIYLWHQPILAFVRIRSLNEPSVLLMTCAVVGTIGLSFLTWKFVEQPFRSARGFRVFPRQASLFAFSLVGILCFAMLGLGGFLEARSKTIFPEHVLKASTDKNDYTFCLSSAAEFTVQLALDHCTYNPGQIKKVVLVGDSHADHYAAALRFGAMTEEYTFVQLTVNSCAPFPGFIAIDKNCDAYAQDVLNWITNVQPDVIVYSMRWTVYMEGTRYSNGEGGTELGVVANFFFGDLVPGTQAYRQRFVDQIATGIEQFPEESEVILVGPSPEAGWHVPQRLQKEIRLGVKDPDNPILDTSYERFLDRNRSTFSHLSKLSGDRLHVFQPHEILCDSVVKDRCVNAWDNTVLYYDDDHFSNSGAMWFAPALIKLVSSKP